MIPDHAVSRKIGIWYNLVEISLLKMPLRDIGEEKECCIRLWRWKMKLWDCSFWTVEGWWQGKSEGGCWTVRNGWISFSCLLAAWLYMGKDWRIQQRGNQSIPGINRKRIFPEMTGFFLGRTLPDRHKPEGLIEYGDEERQSGWIVRLRIEFVYFINDSFVLPAQI